MKHTKGPWYPIQIQDSVWVAYDASTETEQIQPTICDMNRSLPLDEQCANAAIIAAAPEMLVALKVASKVLGKYWFDSDDSYNNEDVIDANNLIDKVIAKAEGK